jgi:hypothetical protein
MCSQPVCWPGVGTEYIKEDKVLMSDLQVRHEGLLKGTLGVKRTTMN